MDIPAQVILEDISCPLGCGKNDEVVLTGHDLLHNLPGEFTVVKCRACGLMRTTPRPTPDTIGYYYPDDYGPYVGTRVQQSNSMATGIKDKLRPIARSIFNFKMTNLPKMSPGRMLEIGCASGVFLHQMAEKGWQVQGIEYSPKAAQAAQQLGYRVHAGPLETAPRPEELLDLIVGWMVLEHLHDPIGCLKKLHEWIKPGGYLVFSVPNTNSMDFRIFKKYCYANQLPNHLFHFTPDSLTRVLENAGWKIEKIHHQRTLSNIIASVGYILRDKGFAKLGQKFIDFPERSSVWTYVLYPLAWLLSMAGQTGRMTVWARVQQK